LPLTWAGLSLTLPGPLAAGPFPGALSIGPACQNQCEPGGQHSQPVGVFHVTHSNKVPSHPRSIDPGLARSQS
jgi:hypothetical protein